MKTAGKALLGKVGTWIMMTSFCRRKYYKCSNGDPSLQSCPGTLIFDSVLKICNWPETTTCISDLLARPRSSRPTSPGFKRSQSSGNSTEYQFSKDVLNALRHAATTEAPVIVNITPANKLSKRILSLFQAKGRKRHRNNILNPKRSDTATSDINPGAFKSSESITFRNIHQRLTTTTTATTSTTSPTTTTTTVTTTRKVTFRPASTSLRLRPNPLRIRQNPLLRTRNKPSPTLSIPPRSQDTNEKNVVPNIFGQLPKVGVPVTETSTAAGDDLEVKVRSESSVSSVSSYVRLSITDLESLQSDERPFSNGRGGEQFVSESGDSLTRLRQELEQLDSNATSPDKPKAKPIKCHTGDSQLNDTRILIVWVLGASNELYAHPRNCRKYYKCQNNEPSLQSCPANLIFDTSLKICNWPTASECVEDPDAPLPQHVTSDREPPQAINSINIDDLGENKPKPVVDFSSASVPTVWEARQREEALKAEYPQFAKVKETVKTLDTKLVERVAPGNADNPDNVKRVEFILSEENYEDLFPRHHPSYTYRRLLQAIAKFPAVCSYVGREEESDAICRKTLATMFAHFTQETGAHNPSDKEFDEWRQGLNVVREQGCTDTSPGCGYNDNCEDTDSITRKWACGKDVWVVICCKTSWHNETLHFRSGKWRKYYGRGAKQLSYNFNYGQFSQAMFDDRRLLLDHPDFVADTWLNLASATWFYTTPQPPKPSMLHVIDGTWIPNEQVSWLPSVIAINDIHVSCYRTSPMG